MSAAPVFAVTPRIGQARISTANTARDGSGTVATLLAAGSSGTRVSSVRVKGTVTTTAGMVRLFAFDATNYRLLDEFVVPAITVSASVPAFADVHQYTDLVLPSGWSLVVSTHNAEQFDVTAFGADL